jgi:hypothetical protein
MAYDADIYHAARLVLDRFGADAELWASRRMEEFVNQQDAAGVAVWSAVLEAIADLQEDEGSV